VTLRHASLAVSCVVRECLLEASVWWCESSLACQCYVGCVCACVVFVCVYAATSPCLCTKGCASWVAVWSGEVCYVCASQLRQNAQRVSVKLSRQPVVWSKLCSPASSEASVLSQSHGAVHVCVRVSFHTIERVV
jgi:hypothetical protein